MSDVEIPLRKSVDPHRKKRKSRSLQKRLSHTFKGKKLDFSPLGSRLSIHPFIKQGDKDALHRVVLANGKRVIHERSITQQTPLHVAAEEGHLNMTEYLLASGAKMEAVDMRGWTPLHCACFCGQIDVVMYLLAAGADCLAVTDDGNTPLHYFVLKSPKDHPLFDQVFRELLLRTTELLDLPNSQGETSLYYAVLCDKETIVKDIIKNKGNVNFSNNNGETPVHLASRNGNLSMIKLLLDSNALPDLESELIGKASNLKELVEFPEIRKLLLSAEKPKKRTRGSRIATPDEDPIVHEIETPRDIERILELELEVAKRKSGSWVGFDTNWRNDGDSNNYSKKKKARPRSARGLRRDLLKESIPRSSSDIMPSSKPANTRMSSLPSASISFHLESVASEKETISEETFLYEEEPTPRTKARNETRSRSKSTSTSERSTVALGEYGFGGSTSARGGSRLGKLSHSGNVSKKRRNSETKEQIQIEKITNNLLETKEMIAGAEEVISTKKTTEVIPDTECEVISDKDIQLTQSMLEGGQFPLQKQVTIPLLRETEGNSDDSEDQVTALERKLTQSQAQTQQLRIELEMTKKLLAKARRKLKEKDKKIYSLEHDF